MKVIGIQSKNTEEVIILDNASLLYNLTMVYFPEFISDNELLKLISEAKIKTIFCELFFLEKILTILS